MCPGSRPRHCSLPYLAAITTGPCGSVEPLAALPTASLPGGRGYPPRKSGGVSGAAKSRLVYRLRPLRELTAPADLSLAGPGTLMPVLISRSQRPVPSLNPPVHVAVRSVLELRATLAGVERVGVSYHARVVLERQADLEDRATLRFRATTALQGRVDGARDKGRLRQRCRQIGDGHEACKRGSLSTHPAWRQATRSGKRGCRWSDLVVQVTAPPSPPRRRHPGRPGRHAMDHKRRETSLPPDASPAAE